MRENRLDKSGIPDENSLLLLLKDYVVGDLNEANCQIFYGYCNMLDISFISKLILYLKYKAKATKRAFELAVKYSYKIAGKKWGRSFYERLIEVPGDIILYISIGQSTLNFRLTNAMKKGFKDAFKSFTVDQFEECIEQYGSLRLIDMINYLHPIPQDSAKPFIKELLTNRKELTKKMISRHEVPAVDCMNDLDEIYRDIIDIKI